MVYAQTVLMSRVVLLANAMPEVVTNVKKDSFSKMVVATHALRLFLDALNAIVEQLALSVQVNFCQFKMVFVLVLAPANSRLLIRIQEHAVVKADIT